MRAEPMLTEEAARGQSYPFEVISWWSSVAQGQPRSREQYGHRG
jgi:hypothetical protein